MSGRLNKYFHQTASWRKSANSFDDYGNPEREAPINIPCRIEKRITIAKDTSGREKTSTILCYIEPQEGITCAEDIMGGAINGMDIISVKEITDGLGKIVGYEVSL